MLTKQEQAWLKKRPNYLTQTVSTYTLSYRSHTKTREWLLLLYESFDLLNEKQKMLDEAGAFESLVIKYLVTHEHCRVSCVSCPSRDKVIGCHKGWCQVKQARLKVEEEM